MVSVRDDYRTAALMRWNVLQSAARELLGSSLADMLAAQVARLIGEPVRVVVTAEHSPVLALAEQMVLDVGAASTFVAPVADLVGADAMREFVSAMWVVEYTERIRAIGSRLFDLGSDELEPINSGPATSSIRDRLADYQNTVVLGDRLDVVTTELVRLRCGRTHQCRICQTLRLDAARAAGVDQEMTDKIDRYETSDLSERHKLALRVTDAMILRPDLLSGDIIEAALDEFGPQTLVELCLDVSKWSTQKIAVTLGLDGTERLPLNEHGTTWFAFGDDGAVTGFWA